MKGVLGIPTKVLLVLVVLTVIAIISILAIMYGKNALDTLLNGMPLGA